MSWLFASSHLRIRLVLVCFFPHPTPQTPTRLAFYAFRVFSPAVVHDLRAHGCFPRRPSLPVPMPRLITVLPQKALLSSFLRLIDFFANGTFANSYFRSFFHSPSAFCSRLARLVPRCFQESLLAGHPPKPLVPPPFRWLSTSRPSLPFCPSPNCVDPEHPGSSPAPLGSIVCFDSVPSNVCSIFHVCIAVVFGFPSYPFLSLVNKTF